jgi:outer membrane cobalamin receptor
MSATFRVTHGLGLASALLALALAWPGGARAQEEEPAPASDLSDLESLLGEEVVTTASRSAERSSTAPATVQIIDAATMRRYGIRSLDEALGLLGLGSFTADTSGDYNTGVDTGFQGVLLRDRNRHVLVLVDGHVMNAQSTGETRLDVALGIPL